MSELNANASLDVLHHIAIEVDSIRPALDWYCENFQCEIVYEDDTWAMLQFANVQLALVIPDQHPPHLGFAVSDADRYGVLKSHRDGSRSVYTSDPSGNVVEMVDASSV